VDAAAQVRRQAVVFRLSAFPGREFRGQVARISRSPIHRRAGGRNRHAESGRRDRRQLRQSRVLDGPPGGGGARTVRGAGADTYVFV
jgi:hypothetical protein